MPRRGCVASSASGSRFGTSRNCPFATTTRSRRGTGSSGSSRSSRKSVAMTREAVLEAIRGARRLTVICHENPDADTLGAGLALQVAAERLGKTAEVVAADGVPPFLAGLPGAETVRRTPGLEPDVAGGGGGALFPTR